MPTEQEVEIESKKFPEVSKLYSRRHREMGIPFSDDRWDQYADEIDKECDALQAKLEARE